MGIASVVLEDPQALAMLVAAVILAAGTLAVLYVVVRRRPTGTRVWATAILLGVVLGVSVGGFVRGLRPYIGDAEAAVARAEAPAADPLQAETTVVAAVQPEVAPALEGAEVEREAVPTTADASPPEAAAPAAAEPAPEVAEPSPEVAEAAAEVVAAPAVAEPEPPAPDRSDAIKAWGKQVRAVMTDAARCSDPKELARLWSSRPTVGREDPERMRAQVATKWLERCRTRIAEELARRLKLARVDARREFSETLRGRLHDKGEAVKVTLEGRNDAKLRITGGTFDEASAEALLDGGLREELAALGFAGVTFARYTKRHRFRIEPEPEAAIVRKELDGLGIGKAFELELAKED